MIMTLNKLNSKGEHLTILTKVLLNLKITHKYFKENLKATCSSYSSSNSNSIDKKTHEM